MTRRLPTLFAALAVLFASFSPVQAQPAPKKVKIAMGTRVISIAYPWLTMPQAMGYWKEEGLDVEVVAVGGSLEANQQLAAGNVEFAQVNSSVVVQSNATNKMTIRSVMLNTVNDWSVVALESLSRPATSNPEAFSRRISAWPIKPALPVIRTFISVHF